MSASLIERLISRAQAATRVVQPTADADTDDERNSDGEGADEHVEHGDFLSEFPDDTDVRMWCGLQETLLTSGQTSKELELVHCRIGPLDELRLSRFAASLRRLCLRQNLVRHLDPETFHQLTNLEELDLYDNRIKHLGNALEKLSGLK